ncbi:Zinc finger, LIM-type [Phaffia rhodozyma]|uniref:Zinc finger, LIM-type n=1 Tax=Phaffia rhodozyma TaxID=264483 RepID=A0A0F7SGY2_PHARH|nr:Zinc finger, LIM-type [Phaffia rhodozyma]
MFCSVCGTILDLSHERCQSCFHKIPGLARARIESSSSLSKKDRWAQQYCTPPTASSSRRLHMSHASSSSGAISSINTSTHDNNTSSGATRLPSSTPRPPGFHRSISNVSTSSTGTASSIDDAQPLIPSLTGSSNASTASLQKVFGSVLDDRTPESAKCSVCKDLFGKLGGGGGGGRIFPLPGTDPASLDARFLCAPCYAKDYKKGDCTLCTQPVLGIINDPSIRVGNSFWHERCFQCTRCAGKATLLNIHRHPTCEQCFHLDPTFIPTAFPPGLANQPIRHSPSSNLGGYALPNSISSSSSRAILRIAPLSTSASTTADNDAYSARSWSESAPSVENLKNRFSFTPAVEQTGLSSRKFDKPNRGHGKSHSVGVAVVRDAHGELAIRKGASKDEPHGIWTPGGFKRDYQSGGKEQIGQKETRGNPDLNILPLVSNTAANIAPPRPSLNMPSAARFSSRTLHSTNITSASRSPVSLAETSVVRDEPTTPRASRFGGMTVCPGCAKSIGPMERGSVVGPARLGCNTSGEERWHQSCLSCGGGTNRGPQKPNKAKLVSPLVESDSRAGCGRPLDSGAKVDDEGGVWCRGCVNTVSRLSASKVLPSSTRSVSRLEPQPARSQPKASHQHARSEDLSRSYHGHTTTGSHAAPCSSVGLGSSARSTYRGVPSSSPSPSSTLFTHTRAGSTDPLKGHMRKDSLKYSAARVAGFRDDSWNPVAGDRPDDTGSAGGTERGDKTTFNVRAVPKNQERSFARVPVVPVIGSVCEDRGNQRQEGKIALPIVGKSGGMSILERAGVRRKV